jgi:ribonuclease T1
LALMLAFVALTVLAPSAEARRHPAHGDATVTIAELPPEARATLERIARGGPFPYSRDGVVFGNREHLLDARPRGYYHEYTVPTPGAGNRGARRIVCGDDVRTLAECYYSDDHYRSFRRIRR